MSTPDVRPGQVWERTGVKTCVRIVAVFNGRARAAPVDRDAVSRAWCPTRGRSSLIRLDRFRPTANGYRLVSDEPASDSSRDTEGAGA
jgi:hypothetical protein